jgi:DNA-binding MarR family transcriptional regulator
MTKEFKELLFRHYFFNNCNTLLKEFGLTKQESMFLIITYNLSKADKNVCLKEIREKMEMSKPSISILMSKLEKKGYIERHLNKQNLREIYVRLSEYSMKIAEKTIKEINNHLNKIIEKMGNGNVEKLIELNNLFDKTSKEILEEVKAC